MSRPCVAVTSLNKILESTVAMFFILDAGALLTRRGRLKFVYGHRIDSRVQSQRSFHAIRDSDRERRALQSAAPGFYLDLTERFFRGRD